MAQDLTLTREEQKLLDTPDIDRIEQFISEVWPSGARTMGLNLPSKKPYYFPRANKLRLGYQIGKIKSLPVEERYDGAIYSAFDLLDTFLPYEFYGEPNDAATTIRAMLVSDLRFFLKHPNVAKNYGYDHLSRSVIEENANNIPERELTYNHTIRSLSGDVRGINLVLQAEGYPTNRVSSFIVRNTYYELFGAFSSDVITPSLLNSGKTRDMGAYAVLEDKGRIPLFDFAYTQALWAIKEMPKEDWPKHPSEVAVIVAEILLMAEVTKFSPDLYLQYN